MSNVWIDLDYENMIPFYEMEEIKATYV